MLLFTINKNIVSNLIHNIPYQHTSAIWHSGPFLHCVLFKSYSCRSSSHHHLVVPRHCRSTLGRRAFSVAGPMAWNDLRDPSLSADNFRKGLKTHLFRNALGWNVAH